MTDYQESTSRLLKTSISTMNEPNSTRIRTLACRSTITYMASSNSFCFVLSFFLLVGLDGDRTRRSAKRPALTLADD